MMREWEDAKVILECLIDDYPDNAEAKKQLAGVKEAMHADEVKHRGQYKNMFARLRQMEEEDAKAKAAAEEAEKKQKEEEEKKAKEAEKKEEPEKKEEEKPAEEKKPEESTEMKD